MALAKHLQRRQQESKLPQGDSEHPCGPILLSVARVIHAGVAVTRPDVAPYRSQHLCLDKGYFGKPVEQEVRKRGYIPHLPAKGTPASTQHRRQGKARRWKVERTHSLVNRARRLLIRWEKKVSTLIDRGARA
jgi:Transposase DDE domain